MTQALTVRYDRGLGWHRLDPLPDPDEVKAYYEDDKFYEEHSPEDWFAKETREHLKGYWAAYYRHLWFQLMKAHKYRPVVHDVGCGSGFWVNWLNRNSGRNHYGHDPSPEATKRASDNGVRPLPKGRKVDALTYILVLEHLYEPLAQVWQDIHEYLHPEGVVLIVVPNDDNPLQRQLGYRGYVSEVHLNYFKPDTLTRFMRRAGLEIVYKGATAPLELAACVGYNYTKGDGSMGRNVHMARLRLEKAFGPLMFALYDAMHRRWGIGRELVYIGRRHD